MPDDIADLVIVDAAFYRRDEGGRNAVSFQILQRLLTYFAQVRTAKIDQRIALKRIELQIDFKAAFVLRQPGHEIGLARDPQAVGIDHHMADRAGANPSRIAKKSGCRVGRRPKSAPDPARLAGHQRVQHLSMVDRDAKLVRAGEDLAKQTGQVRLQCSVISISARQECCS